MSSRLTQVLLALSLLLNCFVLAGFVYRSWIEPPHWQRRWRPPPGQPALSPLEALAQDLKLDDSQKQALQPLFEQYSTTPAATASARSRRCARRWSAELQKPEFDMAKIDALVDQMTGLRAEQQKENLRSIAQLAPQLQPEQRDELHKILAERYGSPPARPWSGGRARRASATVGASSWSLVSVDVVSWAERRRSTAALWLPRPGARRRRWASTRRAICCRAPPSARRRPKSAPSA